jgi:hypothetical protein
MRSRTNSGRARRLNSGPRPSRASASWTIAATVELMIVSPKIEAPATTRRGVSDETASDTAA